MVNIHKIRVRNSHRICFVCVVDFVNGRLIATFISLSVFVYSPDTLQSDVVINGFASIAILCEGNANILTQAAQIMLFDLREFMLVILFRSLSSVLPQKILAEDTILTPLQFILTVVSSRITIRIATCKNFGPCIIQVFRRLLAGYK